MDTKWSKADLEDRVPSSPTGHYGKRIVAVDDSPYERGELVSILREHGYEVAAFETGPDALDRVRRNPPDAVMLDLMLPVMDGLEVLRELKRSHPNLPVIMLTGMDDVRTAVEAIQLGAHNYLTKPLDEERLLVTLGHAIEKSEMIAEMESLRRRVGKPGPALSRIVAQSQAIRTVTAQIRKVADSNLTVLVLGETGTGKEPVARALHEESARRDGPFVPVDCGALPENLLESELFGHEKGAFSGADHRKPGQFTLAGSGTLFLDEIGNLSLALQAKLLRALQEKQVRPVGAVQPIPFQARVVAAANVPLEEAARSGRFRQDLYYRLAEFTIQLPPLRQRPEDILPLALRFQEEACVEFKHSVSSLNPEAVALLKAHDWPGNVRELRNVIRQAVLLAHGPVLQAEQIRALLGSSSQESPGPVAVPVLPGLPLKKIVENAAEQVEKQAILAVLRSTQGNKSQAAKVLEVDYKTLRLKIKKYGLGSWEDPSCADELEA